VNRFIPSSTEAAKVGERTLLFLLHASPFSPHGGTEFQVRDLVEALALDRVVVAYLPVVARLRFEPVNEPTRFEVKPLTLGNFLLAF
jgi:hypothetical protein